MSEASTEGAKRPRTPRDTAFLSVSNIMNAPSLARHRHKWRRVESQVIDWLNNMILIWQEEQPEWYNDQVRATIPDWCVRDKEVRMRLGVK